MNGLPLVVDASIKLGCPVECRMGGVDVDREAGDRRSWSVFGGVGTWTGGVDSRLQLRLRVGGIEWLGQV